MKQAAWGVCEEGRSLCRPLPGQAPVEVVDSTARYPCTPYRGTSLVRNTARCMCACVCVCVTLKLEALSRQRGGCARRGARSAVRSRARLLWRSGIFLLKGPRGALFLMSEVPLYLRPQRSFCRLLPGQAPLEACPQALIDSWIDELIRRLIE